MFTSWRLHLLSALAFVLLGILPPLPAKAAQLAGTNGLANELLRESVGNEKTAAKIGYVAWIDRVERPGGSITKQMVNTPQGLLARVVAINDQPLSDAQRLQEDEHMSRLLNPAAMREKAKKQHEDEQRVERVLAALPDAFRCEYAAEQPGDNTVRLDCAPNRDFSPPNYETEVLKGMKGEIVIDREEKRIVRMSGTLFKDVSFGWGILGRLKRGGQIEIQQQKVLPRQWSITRLQMRFDGKIMLFKSLHVQQTETGSNFRVVPEMTVAEALDFLRSSPTPIAVNAD
jgi:hypothetical protein